MAGGLFFAGSVLVPLVFGLVPAFLPLRSPAALRWGLWLVLLGLAGWYGEAMRDAPAAYQFIAWTTIAISATLSLVVLIAETGRPRRMHAHHALPIADSAPRGRS
jgi:FtsH-binding integral membrane protein